MRAGSSNARAALGCSRLSPARRLATKKRWRPATVNFFAGRQAAMFSALRMVLGMDLASPKASAKVLVRVLRAALVSVGPTPKKIDHSSFDCPIDLSLCPGDSNW